MSNRVFQGVVLQLKEGTDRAIGVLDADGTVIASGNNALLGERWSDLIGTSALGQDGIIRSAGKTLKAFGNLSCPEFYVFAEGTDETARSIVTMASVALNGAKIYHEEKYDKGTFVKNIITDNIMPGDIYIRAKELHFPAEVHRAVFLVRQIGKTDVSAVEVLKNTFSDKQQNFVLNINECDIAVIKQVSEGTEVSDLMRVAESMEKLLREELSIKTVIGVGTVAEHLRELADSYKEAQVAIEVGKVFETEKTIINYENLGIGRLIYQLPTTLCDIFLSEVFKKNSIDALDQDTLFTINKFFENNLNVSETSRKLYCHRNTLVYRLEKIKKMTGLDLREFDHAIVFKVALMVRKYLASRENRTV